MTRFVVHTSAAHELAASRAEIPARHELLAPTLIRSQFMSELHTMTRRSEISAEEGKERLAWLVRAKPRLLGDAVLREVAWKYADELGWDSTYEAEYIALTKLQGDALLTVDEKLAESASKFVDVATMEDLLG